MRVLVALACGALASTFLTARADELRGQPPADQLEQARALDRQGVRAYQDGRYEDAIVYFARALALGGPSLELWNIAKCRLKLDDPERAHDALDAYLTRSDLSHDDRDEAERQRDVLERRPSPVTITSTPSGAAVSIDDRRVGVTPLTVTVAAGDHDVTLEAKGLRPFATVANARLGRVIVITAVLTRPPVPPAVEPHGVHRVSIEGGAGVGLTRYAGAAGSAMPTGYLLGTFALVETERTFVAFGARIAVAGDHWGTSPGVSNATTQPSCKPAIEYTDAALLAHVVGAVGFRFTERLRAGVDLGFGLVASTANDVGGDVFVPQCRASLGVQPAFHASFDVSYRVLGPLRAVGRPIVFDVSPAFAGARMSPIDATGAWMRFGFTLGAAVDF